MNNFDCIPKDKDQHKLINFPINQLQLSKRNFKNKEQKNKLKNYK